MSTDRARRRPDVTTTLLVGGPEPVTVSLHPYDERWPGVFEEHRRRIERALAPGVAQVEHIGSTAVPGLAAKPIVDLVVVVQDITAEEDHVDLLIAAGYLLRVRQPGHRLVRTPERDVHVHLVQRGDPALDAHLLLRDRLRADPEDRARYEGVKRALLADRWDDMNDYAHAKSEVIAAVLQRARAAGEGPARAQGG